jgi:hypothetical protein
LVCPAMSDDRRGSASVDEHVRYVARNTLIGNTVPNTSCLPLIISRPLVIGDSTFELQRRSLLGSADTRFFRIGFGPAYLELIRQTPPVARYDSYLFLRRRRTSSRIQCVHTGTSSPERIRADLETPAREPLSTSLARPQLCCAGRPLCPTHAGLDSLGYATLLLTARRVRLPEPPNALHVARVICRPP